MARPDTRNRRYFDGGLDPDLVAIFGWLREPDGTTMHAISTKLCATGIVGVAPKVEGVRDWSRPAGGSPASMCECLLVPRVPHLSVKTTSLYFRDRVSARDEWRNPDTEEKEIGQGAWVDRKQKGLLSRPGTGGRSETDGLGKQEGEVSGDRSDLEKPASVGVLPRSPLPAARRNPQIKWSR